MPGRHQKIVDRTPTESVQRIVRFGKRGLLRLDQRIEVADQKTGNDVSGPYWIFGLVRVERGKIFYRAGRELIDAGDSFAMFVPPYSLIEVRCEHSLSFSMGLASKKPPPDGSPKVPVIFSSAASRCPASISEVAALLASAKDFTEVDRLRGCSAVTAKAKTLIDRNYASALSIAETAHRLRAHPSLLARYFKRDAGMPPVRYRHWLRIMDAMMKLMEGQAVADVALDVGFDDLSRFYKQFRPIAHAAPGRYRP